MIILKSSKDDVYVVPPFLVLRLTDDVYPSPVAVPVFANMIIGRRISPFLLRETEEEGVGDGGILKTGIQLEGAIPSVPRVVDAPSYALT